MKETWGVPRAYRTPAAISWPTVPAGRALGLPSVSMAHSAAITGRKLKPFSSVVLFEDQNVSNPVRDEPAPAGSLIDALFLSQYVHLSAQRQTAYQARTLTLFAVEDLNRVLMLGSAGAPPDGKNLLSFLLDWLSRPA